MSFSYKAMLACLFGALTILPTMALADTATSVKPDSQTQSQTEDKRKTLMADATIAVQETQAALKNLDDGNSREALAALERASGKLDVILARDPTLRLAPAGVSVATYDIQGGLGTRLVSPVETSYSEEQFVFTYRTPHRAQRLYTSVLATALSTALSPTVMALLAAQDTHELDAPEGYPSRYRYG